MVKLSFVSWNTKELEGLFLSLEKAVWQKNLNTMSSCVVFPVPQTIQHLKISAGAP